MERSKPIEGFIKLLNEKNEVLFTFRGEVVNNFIAITTLVQGNLDFYKCVKGVLKYFSAPGKKLMLNMHNRFKEANKTSCVIDEDEYRRKEILKAIFNFISSKFYNCAIFPNVDYEELLERYTINFITNWNILISPRYQSSIVSKSIFISSKPGCIKEMELRSSYLHPKSILSTTSKHSLKKHIHEELELSIKSKQSDRSKITQVIINAQQYSQNCVRSYIAKAHEIAQYLVNEECDSDRYSEHIINLVLRLYCGIVNLLNGKGTAISNPLLYKAAEYFGLKLDIESKLTEEARRNTKSHIISLIKSAINYYNKIMPQSLGQTGFKYYIGEGNNSCLIASLMRQRYWWTKAKKSQKNTCNFIWTQWKKNSYFQYLLDVEGMPQIYNHIDYNHHLSNKKNLFLNMKAFYQAKGINPFDILPITYLIKDCTSEDYQNLMQSVQTFAAKKEYVWIIKPGENTNRGAQISIANGIDQINKHIANLALEKHSAIVQKYIENPLLIMNRKFDIRCYGMITCVNSCMKGYYYKIGYIRTSSKEYNLKNLDSKYIHLTNDAIQKNSEEYGKYECGNKMSYNEFAKYLGSQEEYKSIRLKDTILHRIKEIIADTFRAVSKKLDPEKRKHTFEVS